jgi:hypothetical protein
MRMVRKVYYPPHRNKSTLLKEKEARADDEN